MASLQLIQFFEQRRERGTPLVLVTVIETFGSTYSKAGHRMLIDDQNLYHGLVSGGCLEGDLLEHAKLVFKDGRARIVTYDLRGDDDALWGLGIGCNGLTRLLLQLLAAENDYEPMRSIVHTWQTQLSRTITCVIASTHPQIPIGSTLIRSVSGGDPSHGLRSDPLDLITRSVTELTPIGPGITRLSALIDGYDVKALQQLLVGLPRVLVLGAGPDAVPVVHGFLALGWRVSVGDHREVALMRPEFGELPRLFVRDDAILQAFLREQPPSAIIIMSHNLQTDARYLKLVADCDCVYLGVLGPSLRRAKLLGSLDPQIRTRLEPRLFGPIGLEIGSDSPASIALSIVAQVFVEIRRSSSGLGTLTKPQDTTLLATGDRGGSTERISSPD
jgi:xanthine dehydrogenase accessory factor